MEAHLEEAMAAVLVMHQAVAVVLEGCLEAYWAAARKASRAIAVTATATAQRRPAVLILVPHPQHRINQAASLEASTVVLQVKAAILLPVPDSNMDKVREVTAKILTSIISIRDLRTSNRDMALRLDLEDNLAMADSMEDHLQVMGNKLAMADPLVTALRVGLMGDRKIMTTTSTTSMAVSPTHKTSMEEASTPHHNSNSRAMGDTTRAAHQRLAGRLCIIEFPQNCDIAGGLLR